MAEKSSSRVPTPANHPVVELIDPIAETAKQSSEVYEKIETGIKYAGKAMRVVSLPLAFRKYSWLHLAPLMNVSGNLRGIVINARARAVYDVAVKGGEVAEKFGKAAKFFGGLAAVALSLHSVYEETLDIVHSTDDNATKASKLSTQLTSFGLRTIAGVAVIPETHLILHAIAAVSGHTQALFPGQKDTLSFIKETAQQSDADLDTQVKNFTDGKQIYNYLQVGVQPVLDRAFGFNRS